MFGPPSHTVCWTATLRSRGREDRHGLRPIATVTARSVPGTSSSQRHPTGCWRRRDNTAVCAEVNRHRHHARHDELTGLLNRIAFKDAIECEVDRHKATGRPGAVLMLDLDNFKLINDTMGHDVGDATLQAVADGIREVVGGDDHAARLGGDEFAVILRDVLALDQLRATVEKLLESLGRPVTIKGRTVVPRGSIGAALFPKHGQTAAAHSQECRRRLVRREIGRPRGVRRVRSFDGPADPAACGGRCRDASGTRGRPARRRLSAHRQS